MDYIQHSDLLNAIKQYRQGGGVKTPVSSIDTEIQSDEGLKYLTGGNWYELYPNKKLGDIVLTKDRYGKEIQLLKGDISILNKIEVETDFAQFRKSQGIGVTAIKEGVSGLIKEPATSKFVEDIIEKSNKEIGQKAVARVKKKQSAISESLESAEIQTYQEIYKQLNSNISLEELRCYIWYKANIGQRVSSEWYELAEYWMDAKDDEERISQWIRDGILFYFKGELLPLPIYCSGDIYSKVNRIVKVGENSGGDIEYIIDNYGESVLANQLNTINNSFSVLNSKKLIITGSTDNNSLVLKPTSKFAKEFMVSELESMEDLKWFISGRKENKGEIDLYKTDGYDYKKEKFDSLSLTHSFGLWLLQNRFSLEIKGNITANDIIYFYLDGRTKQAPTNYEGEQLKAWKAQLLRTKAKASSEGERLFAIFLNSELSLNQKVSIESSWNSLFNNYLTPDFSKIPIAFNICKKFYDEFPFEVKAEKREAVSFLFNEGSGCLAYDVGVGKTISAIMAIEQFIVAGYSKRPFVVVPNQTYKQWLSEIKNALPHREINGLYNLSRDFLNKLSDDEGNVSMVKEGTISVLTYEGFENIGFNDQTKGELLHELYEILNQGGASLLADKKRASFYEKLENIIGRGLKGTRIEIENLGFDLVCFDEAHALKKVFTSVKGEQENENNKKSKNPYQIQSGIPSSTALKGFMIGNYIFRKNNYRNVILLTATPFTNSPLEVFSMLSLVAYHQLEKLGIKNITDFFDNFIDMQTELVINHKLKPQYKQIVKGYNNLPALQKIILRYFNYKTGEDVGVIRPNKIVIPLVSKLVNGEVMKIPSKEQITCNIELSPNQQMLMNEIVSYAEGNGSLGNMNVPETSFSDFEQDENEGYEGEEMDEDSMDSKEKSGVRALKSMNYSRNLALSPYLYAFSNLSNPTYLEYVNTSPKLIYVMECIKSVKKYHEERGEPISGQVIYMDRGIEYFNLLKDYLIYEVGFKKHEVGEISSKMSKEKKSFVQNSFLGKKYNEKTMEFENIDDSERIKVLIGSSTIKEGINLQKKATVLYNCFVDWNPTDMIQLQGRIWRQQNEFMNVRIVNPLMIDSMDIFMFQKLEEKTARLNTIWSNDGKSVLKLEEVNPEEIKFALIKDPRVIAHLESEQGKVTILDDINALQVTNLRIEKYLEAKKDLDYYKDSVDKIINLVSPSRIAMDMMQKINFLVSFYKQDYPKDDEGRVVLGWWDYKHNMVSIKAKLPDGTEFAPYEKPSITMSNLTQPKRLIEKENKELFAPKNIQPEFAINFKNDNIAKISELELRLNQITAEDFIKSRAEEITEERIRNKYEIKPISKMVDEFASLNYLLSIKRPKTQSNKVVVELPIIKKLEHLINLL